MAPPADDNHPLFDRSKPRYDPLATLKTTLESIRGKEREAVEQAARAHSAKLNPKRDENCSLCGQYFCECGEMDPT